MDFVHIKVSLVIGNQLLYESCREFPAIKGNKCKVKATRDFLQLEFSMICALLWKLNTQAIMDLLLLKNK